MKQNPFMTENELTTLFRSADAQFPTKRQVIQHVNQHIHELLLNFKAKHPNYPVFIEVTDKSDDTVFHGEIIYFMQNHKGWVIYDENHGGTHQVEGDIHQYVEGYMINDDGEIEKGVYVGYDSDYIERLYYYKGKNSQYIDTLETL